MAIVVPLAAGRLGRGKSGVDRYFFGSCALLTFLFIGFVPRGILDPALAAGATFAFSGLVALVYLALSPFARHATVGLLVLLGVVDIAGLAVVHFSARRGLAYLPFSLLTLAVTAVAGFAALWVIERFGSKGAARMH
ncbi:MAG TPA: hypothetical protein VN177_06680 [Myxococcales bacterium]|nr:hypothetical protein [Myxococcales bacterium]